jgi:hypothetical protein
LSKFGIGRVGVCFTQYQYTVNLNNKLVVQFKIPDVRELNLTDADGNPEVVKVQSGELTVGQFNRVMGSTIFITPELTTIRP